MSYSAIHIFLNPVSGEYADILYALLDVNLFEGITENDSGYIAYIPTDKLNLSLLDEIKHSLHEIGCEMKWTAEEIPDQNWNMLWESNFDPVIIDQKCVIRAPFHDKFSDIPLRITIEPKMSFGTGHHQTTRLMLEQMLCIDFNEKQVLDMGCGTGVLGILASLLGASLVYCIDPDRWAYENALENIARNSVSNIHLIQGGKEKIPERVFDVVLANINRNILIDQIPVYSTITKKGSLLLISGTLDDDSPLIRQTAGENQFTYVESRLLDGWKMIVFKRI